jgi:hypothetical protein
LNLWTQIRNGAQKDLEKWTQSRISCKEFFELFNQKKKEIRRAAVQGKRTLDAESDDGLAFKRARRTPNLGRSLGSLSREEVMQSISAGVAQVLAASSPESFARVAGSPNAIADALLSPLLLAQGNRRPAAEETPRGTR